MSDDCESSKTFCAREVFLASALYDGLEDCNISHLKTILQNRDANPNVIIPKHGISPFHLAIGNESEDFAEEVTRLFLQYGGNPNVRSVDKQTPVHIAAAWGRARILRLLLLNGGDPWIHDSDDNSAFHYAYKEQHWNALELLQSFWLIDSYKVEDSDKEKYILTFEKVFVYGKNVAYEYRAESKPPCTPQTGSVTMRTRASYNAVSWVPKNGHNHQESVALITNHSSIIKDQINEGCSITTQELSSAVPEITVNGYPESKPYRVDVIPGEECNNYGHAAKCQMRDAPTPELEEESLKKGIQRDSPYNSSAAADVDLKEKVLEELKSHNLSTAEEILYNSEDRICEKCFQKLVPKYFPEISVDKSLNIIKNNENLPLKFVEVLNVENGNGLQAMGNKAAGVVSQTKTAIAKHKIPTIYECRARNIPLPVNATVSESDVVTACKSHNIFTSHDDGCHRTGKGHGVFKYEWNNEIKDDRITDYCGSKLRNGFDVSSPEMIPEEEWLASQSCFDLSESSDYFTCDDIYPMVNITDISVRINGEMTNHIKNNAYNSNGRTSPCMTASLSSSRSIDSFVSLSEEYKYSDEEGGVVLLETRFLVPAVSISDLRSEKVECKTADPPTPSRPQDEVCYTGQSTSSDTSIPSSLDYDTDVLRGKLKDNGYIPGPIVPTTKRLYLRKLLRLQRKPIQISAETKVYSPELQRTIQDFNWQKWLPDYQILEKDVAQQFSQPEPLRRWREGITKSSFTYLLLDPRITNNLPCRAEFLSESQTWSTFLSSVFYIGKGKRSRPYYHLYQAFAVWNKKTVGKTNQKVQFILDIWKAGMGVVCLHVFQNVIPVEAYTHEASMMDAIDVRNLKNARCGEYYGAAATWTSHQKRMLGTYLLYRAMCIFLHEGERQLRPGDLG